MAKRANTAGGGSFSSSIGKSIGKIATQTASNAVTTAKKATNNPVQIGKNVALKVASQSGKTSSNVGKSASKVAENAVKKVNNTVVSAVSGSVPAATKILATSSGNSKLRNAVIAATGTTVYNDAIISPGKKQTNGEINVANLPVYNRAGNYIEGQKVKVKGLDGKWYVGTVKLDGYIGTGGARQFKFVPDNLGAYNKGMEITPTDKWELSFAAENDPQIAKTAHELRNNIEYKPGMIVASVIMNGK